MKDLDPQELASALADAHAAWPLIEVSPPVFSRWLADRLGPTRRLSSLKASDLYLACACAANDPHALRAFDEHVLDAVEPALRRLSMSNETIEETKQVLRRRFFVSEDGAPPRITEYSGRGALRNWVRVAAVRAAIRVTRRPKGQVDVDSSVIRALASPGADLELEYMKRRYVSEFESALREAFEKLPPRTRNVLRCYYAERLTIDAIASIYHTHRATAARWVHQSVDALVDETRLLMLARLGSGGENVSSIIQLIVSRLDIALSHVFFEKGPPMSASDVPEDEAGAK